jgi:poly(A) polymerase
LLKPKNFNLNSPAQPVSAPATTARIIPRAEHTISRSGISPNALRVLYRLREGGFQGFLVGGCVRDLLLGIEPKDFDVATDALPEQVRKLFRNCRLIGRRFRLAHVYFGRDIIEVATFRAATVPFSAPEALSDPDAEEEDDEAKQLDTEESDSAASEPTVLDADTERLFDKSGRILYDNVYGTIEEDVWRRDFTANALYYNIADFSVWDYVGGVEDIAARRLKLIGDPDTRYREDPVRMLRAARFEAKLAFSIDPATAEPLERLRERLGDVPPARLFEEVLKLFLNGSGEKSLAVLRRRGLLSVLLPSVELYLASERGPAAEALLLRGLSNTDARVREGKAVTPSFLFALLLYGPIARLIEAAPPERWHDIPTILDACDRAVREAQKHVLIPRRFSLGLREMFALQPRLEHPRGRRALRVLEHPRFRAAYDLLQLRAQASLASQERADWWKRLQEVSAEEREELIAGLEQPGANGPRPAGRRRGVRRRRRAHSAGPV